MPDWVYREPHFQLRRAPLVPAASSVNHYQASISESWSTYSESVAVVYNAKVAAAESVSNSESVAAIKRSVQAVSETWSAYSESLATVYNAKVTDGESVSYSEVLTRPSGSQYQAPISESWSTYSESVAVTRGTRPAISETWSTYSESVTAKYNAKVTDFEAFVNFESLNLPSANSEDEWHPDHYHQGWIPGFYAES